MNKEYFLQVLKSRLAYLEEKELNKILKYYEDIINKQMSKGIDEFTAVKDLGPVIDIVYNIKNNTKKEEVIKEKEIVKENIIDEVVEKKSNKKIILLTSPLWGLATLLVFSLMILTYIAALVLFFLGLIMVFTAFSTLGSPIPTIMFGLGTGLGLFGLAILVIPVAILVTNIVLDKSKYYLGILKEELK